MDYQTHFITPLAYRYAKTQHATTHHNLQNTLYKTTALSDSVNTPYHFLLIRTKYNTWLQQLPAYHIPANESATIIHRHYHLLHKSLKHTVRTHKQLHQSLCSILGHQRKKVIDHKLNINLLSKACHMVHPKERTPSQLCATTTTHKAPGLPPLITYATTIPTQLTATHDTYSR